MSWHTGGLATRYESRRFASRGSESSVGGVEVNREDA